MADQRVTKIRSRRDSDLPALGRVLMEVHERDGYPVEGVADPRAWLTTPRMLGAWTAELDGAPVGHVLLSRPSEGDAAADIWIRHDDTRAESVAVLGRLFVSPRARGQHLGRRLAERATQEALTMGRRTVLDVMAKDTAAIRTYEALGWQQLAEITHTFEGGRTAPAIAYVSPDQSAERRRYIPTTS